MPWKDLSVSLLNLYSSLVTWGAAIEADSRAAANYVLQAEVPKEP